MNSQEMYEKMKAKLERVVPDVELHFKAEIAVEIEELKETAQRRHPGAQLHGTRPIPLDTGFHRRFA